MDALDMNLENCHGIGSLRYALRFPARMPHAAIYASNGTMKSSLAKTLAEIASGDPTADDIHMERETVRDVVDDDGNPLDPESILVVRSYENAPTTEDMHTGILVSAPLRDRYGAAIREIAGHKNSLLERLSNRSGVKPAEIESRLIDDLAPEGEDREPFYDVLEASFDPNLPVPEGLSDIKYDILFNAATKGIWGRGDLAGLIDEYIKKYDELVETSQYLNRQFNHTSATSVKNTLDSAGFFKANHVIGMRPKEGGDLVQMESAGELEGTIKRDVDRIKKGLDAKWDEIDKAIVRNRDVRALRDYLNDNKALIPLLGDIGGLKRLLWKIYMAQEGDAVKSLLESRSSHENDVAEIVSAAARERTRWEDAIDIFHRRFDVPFRMSVANKPHAVIGEEAPRLEYAFHEDRDGPGKKVTRDQLDKALSMGEKKAFFILNAIFMIEEKKMDGRATLLVLDDLVDSFDYKNKYAVVEYLKDLSDTPALHLLILTHNFDFLRTIRSRGVVGYSGCHFVERGDGGRIALRGASHLNNPLAGITDKLDDPARLVAAIPFARNIVEYTQGIECSDYAALSDMLHWRSGRTDKATVDGLLRIIGSTFKNATVEGNSLRGRRVLDLVLGEADRLASHSAEADLYGKIALAVAIRIRAERFMTLALEELGQAPQTGSPGTHNLIQEYKKRHDSLQADGSADPCAASKILDKVALMTPEVIHLNTFMYEPILDMSAHHLVGLYQEVRKIDRQGRPACGAPLPSLDAWLEGGAGGRKGGAHRGC